MTTSKYTSEFIERFHSQINKTNDPDECWEWKGYILANGYGGIVLGSQRFYTHRLAYELYYGVAPGKLFVCHACDNRSCCNPAHLWLGTASDNTRDMYRKGRQGNKIKGSIFSLESDHIEIKKKKGDIILISKEDIDLVEMRVYVNKGKDGSGKYASVIYPDGKRIMMHKLISSRILGREIADYERIIHLDGNEFNNQRNNLRARLRIVDLTVNQVLDIRALRRMTDVSHKELACIYNVSKNTINKIIQNKILEWLI